MPAYLSAKPQERAKSGEDDGPVDDDGQDGSDGDDDEGLEAAAEQDGLQGEVLRGKNMDVASMDALKQRIEVRTTLMRTLCSENVWIGRKRNLWK